MACVKRLKSDVFKENETIFIEYFDDGQGLNISRIKSMAIKNKLISSDETLTDEGIANLIFESGFSTREEATNISGRGMGMDIIKQAIEEEDGSINIVFTDEKSESDQRKFKFVITMPFDAKHFFMAA